MDVGGLAGAWWDRDFKQETCPGGHTERERVCQCGRLDKFLVVG